MEELNKNICLISCTLTMDDKMVNVWNTLNKELEQMNYKMILLTNNMHPDFQFDYIHVPFTLDEFNDLNITTNDSIQYDEQVTALNMAQKEVEWFNKDSKLWFRHYLGYFKCKSFYRSLIKALSPSVIIAWQNSLPQSNILKRLAEEYSIPNYILERGMLPDTFMLEKTGNVALSELVNNHSLRKVISDNTEDKDYETVKEYYSSNKPAKYIQKQYSDSENEFEQFNLSSNPLLVYFTHVDSAVGAYPADTFLAGKTAGAFRSTEESIKALSELAELRNYNLIIKLHPHDKHSFEEYNSAKVRIIKDFNYQFLMDKADALIFSCSTLQFESLLYNKPVVLLNKTEISGFNIAYEVPGKDSLNMAVEDSLNRKGFSEKMTNARRYIHWIANYYLFGFGKEIPVKNNLSDLAKQISITGVPSILPMYERKITSLYNYLSLINYDKSYSRQDISDVKTKETIEQPDSIDSTSLETLALLKKSYNGLEYFSEDSELLEKTGKIFYHLGDYSNASAFLAKAKQLQNPNAYGKRESDEKGERIGGETADAAEMLKYGPLLEEAQSKIDEQNYFDAFLLLKRIMNRAPGLEEAKIKFSALLEMAENKRKDEKWGSKNSVSNLMEAENLIEAQNYALAKSKLGKILNMELYHIEAINDLAVLNILENNLGYAFGLINLVLELEPENEVAAGNMIYLKSQNPDIETEYEQLFITKISKQTPNGDSSDTAASVKEIL